MLPISKEKALQRWDTLPDNLRDALCAETNSDFIWKTCKDEHLSDEKIYAVTRITGYVLMGFVHPDDASKEVQNAISLDARIADPIMAAINTRIFTPLRQSIDSIYEPADKMGFKPNMLGGLGGPMIIEEVKKSVGTAPAGAQKSASSVPDKSTESPAPKPFILQDNAPSGLNKKSSDFHVEISDDKLKSLSKVPRPMPIKLAVLELGNIPEKAPMPKPAGDKKYEGEFGSFSPLTKDSKEMPKPSNSFENITGKTPEKNRTITEITVSMPMPEKKPEAQAMPIPMKKSTEIVTPIMPIPAAPIPPKPLSAPTEIPQPTFGETRPPMPPQIPEKKPIGQIPAPITIPAKKPSESAKPKFSFSISTPTIAPAKVPSKPVIIQKNYSEADLPQKLPAPPQTPPSKIPVPPKKN